MGEPADEREAVLQGLRDTRAAFDAAREQYDSAMQERRQQLYALLARGKAAGVGRKAMAKAAGLNLPSLSKIIEERDDD